MKQRKPERKPVATGHPLAIVLGIGVIGAALAAGYKSTALSSRPSSPQPAPSTAAGAHHAEGVRYISDKRTYTLPPGRAMEFMYRLNVGGAMLYGWKASATVEFDLHNEPTDNPAGAQTIMKGNDTERHGSYSAPFDGLHGWFWQNNSSQPVTIELTAAGFFRGGRVFHDDGSSEDAEVPAR